MHAVAASIEPTVDRQSMSLRDIHHRFVGRALARLQGRVCIVVDRCLFGLERLPVIRRVAPRDALPTPQTLPTRPTDAVLRLRT